MGPGAFDEVLGSDLLFRSLGLRRAAERSAAAYPAWVMADLQAYADGVNLWLARNPLPPEYAALELSKASVRPWTPVDSIAIFKHLTALISFTNFEAELQNTGLLLGYEDAGRARGFDGDKLFFEDVGRTEPFDHTVSIPPGATSGALAARRDTRRAAPKLRREQLAAAADFVRRGQALGSSVPRLGGSNWWLVSGAKSATGFPLLAGDPHLPLPSPPVWHEIALDVAGHGHGADARHGGGTRHHDGMTVYGGGVPGVPGVVQGFDDDLMWSSTVHPLDDADFFQERVVVRDGVPVATVYKGVAEPLTTIPETFRVNRLDGVPDNVEALPAGVRPSGLAVPAATLRGAAPEQRAADHGPLGRAGEETAIGVAFTVLRPRASSRRCCASTTRAACASSSARCTSSTSAGRTGASPTPGEHRLLDGRRDSAA